jgi:crotonyl-CoA reductase
VKLGDLVLVWGATGGLGAYGAQLAKAAGCEVVAVVSSEQKVQLAEDLGCELVVDRRELSGSNPDGLRSLDVCRALRKLIRARFGRDPDHVFEYVGRETFGASVFLAARGGSVVTCGSSTGYEHEYDNRHLWMKVKRIIGSHAANYGEAEAAARLIDSGVVAPALSDVFPLREAPQAARTVHEGRHVGKIGVLCLAQSSGQGVSNPARRATLPRDRLELFRDFARRMASEGGAAPPSFGSEVSDAS